MSESLIFLIKLAWSLKYRLPCLIAVSFFLLDIRMQLEIHVHMRRIEIEPPQDQPLRGGGYAEDDVETNESDSSSSWYTIEED